MHTLTSIDQEKIYAEEIMVIVAVVHLAAGSDGARKDEWSRFLIMRAINKEPIKTVSSRDRALQDSGTSTAIAPLSNIQRSYGHLVKIS